MGCEFKVGDIVELIRDGSVQYHSNWDREYIQKCGPLRILRILAIGEVLPNRVEIYVQALDDPQAHIHGSSTPNWFFYPEELVKDEFLTAVRRRRHAQR